jgi:SAM-dependent methyltransferase
MRRTDYTAANRRAWNEISVRHRAQRAEMLMAELAVKGASCLDPIVTARLGAIGVAGKRVAQLCCNDGREVISLKNLGAARAVGFDISRVALDTGVALAAHAGVTCELIESDIYEIPATYDGQFDLVYISVGALGWMPDLPGFFAVAARLLVPGGQLLIYEMHPLADMFEPGRGATLAHSYFKTDPFVGDGLDYYGDLSHRGEAEEYWFHHTLGAIITALAQSGLCVVALEELPGDISNVFPDLPATPTPPPLSYLLEGRKPG